MLSFREYISTEIYTKRWCGNSWKEDKIIRTKQPNILSSQKSKDFTNTVIGERRNIILCSRLHLVLCLLQQIKLMRHNRDSKSCLSHTQNKLFNSQALSLQREMNWFCFNLFVIYSFVAVNSIKYKSPPSQYKKYLLEVPWK